MVLDPEIWGPKYWFVLMTISLNYPLYPNEISKKKYYDLIQNIPLLIPVKDISKDNSILFMWVTDPLLEKA